MMKTFDRVGLRVLATFATDKPDDPRFWRTIRETMNALNDQAEESGRPRVWTLQSAWRRITDLQSARALECSRPGYDHRIEQAAGRKWRVTDFGIEQLQRGGYVTTLNWLPNPTDDEQESSE